MKTILFTVLMMCSLLCSGQYGGFGFVDISYSTIGEAFIDATSESFRNDTQLNENGIAFGGSGKFMFNKFSVGGGGGIAFINSDSDFVKMNVGHGYGTFGYNLFGSEELIVNVSGRLGGFGNTLMLDASDENSIIFGDTVYESMNDLTSGAFMYGAEIDVLYFITQVPGLVVGISGYFMAPFNLLTWSDASGTELMGIEQGEYTHFGVSLKIGGGGFAY